jgi:hypothetical protein
LGTRDDKVVGREDTRAEYCNEQYERVLVENSNDWPFSGA